MTNITPIAIILVIVIIICLIATYYVDKFTGSSWEVFIVTFVAFSSLVTFAFYYYFVRQTDDVERYQLVAIEQYNSDKMVAITVAKRDEAWAVLTTQYLNYLVTTKQYDKDYTLFFQARTDPILTEYWQNNRDEYPRQTQRIGNQLFR
jgi:hypothetical protein